MGYPFDSSASIPASATPEAAARSVWDVAVVGAGPAGTLAARELARRGVSVLLVDKSAFPRPKVCGSCLNRSVLDTLDLVGLDDLTVRLGAVRLTAFAVSARGGRARFALPAGASLSRSALDAALVRAAIAAGAVFLPRTLAEVCPKSVANGRRITLHHDGRTAEVSARYVLAADGLGSPCLRNEPGFRAPAEGGSWIGASAALPFPQGSFSPGTIFMACGDGGYVGAVRLEDGRLNIAAALDPAQVRAAGGPAAAAARIARDAGWPPMPGLDEADWRGTPGLTRRAPRHAPAHVLLVGDAAGYVEPFTGEGIAWALASGAAVAPLLVRALRHPGFNVGAAWSCLRGELVGRQQAHCRWITGSLRYPGLVRAALAVLGFLPGLATPVINRLNRSPLRERGRWNELQPVS